MIFQTFKIHRAHVVLSWTADFVQFTLGVSKESYMQHFFCLNHHLFLYKAYFYKDFILAISINRIETLFKDWYDGKKTEI